MSDLIDDPNTLEELHTIEEVDNLCLFLNCSFINPLLYYAIFSLTILGSLGLYDLQVVVTREKGEEVAEAIGASGYFETSAKNNLVVYETFQFAAQSAFTRRGEAKGCCDIL